MAHMWVNKSVDKYQITVFEIHLNIVQTFIPIQYIGIILNYFQNLKYNACHTYAGSINIINKSYFKLFRNFVHRHL